jgi:hypothetical protein
LPQHVACKEAIWLNVYKTKHWNKSKLQLLEQKKRGSTVDHWRSHGPPLMHSFIHSFIHTWTETWSK